MPIIKSAKKKLRADLRKRAINLRTKRRLKETLKEFDGQPTPATLSAAYSVLDTAAKKNILPKKRADRKKARLSATFAKSTPKKASNKASLSAKDLSTKKTTKRTRKTA